MTDFNFSFIMLQELNISNAIEVAIATRQVGVREDVEGCLRVIAEMDQDSRIDLLGYRRIFYRLSW